jgi:hypothetical protein
MEMLPNSEGHTTEMGNVQEGEIYPFKSYYILILMYGAEIYLWFI